jgi:hypothetical protein
MWSYPHITEGQFQSYAKVSLYSFLFMNVVLSANNGPIICESHTCISLVICDLLSCISFFVMNVVLSAYNEWTIPISTEIKTLQLVVWSSKKMKASCRGNVAFSYERTYMLWCDVKTMIRNAAFSNKRAFMLWCDVKAMTWNVAFNFSVVS